MKRFVLTCVLCSAALGLGAVAFSPLNLVERLFSASAAPATKDQLIKALLAMPAPPPPNPLEPPAAQHDQSFYDPKTPPPDNASIEDLIDYWSHQNSQYRGSQFYVPRPSARVADRLLDECQSDPSLLTDILNVLSPDARTIDVVKQIYDRTPRADGVSQQLKTWLMTNSPFFEDSLERVAQRAKDNQNQYIDANVETDVLALAHVDWERARPIVDRLYSDDTQPVSKVLATWALYKHALDAGDLGDIDRYRTELMRTVENKQLPSGVRDKANDALTHEADFPGRDDWTFSLFEDETLVNMPQYTMLTTLFMYSPPDKYTSKLIDLVRNNNELVRSAAARCLVTVFDRSQDPEVARALLPWLENPKWIKEPRGDDSIRQRLVIFFQNHKMPESVPGLLVALDEKQTRMVPDYSAMSGNSNSNAFVMNGAAVNSYRAAINAARSNAAANVNIEDVLPKKEETTYPLRMAAITALATQADPRAVPALRRLLTRPSGDGPEYERGLLVHAILACGGFAISEQVDALEKYARNGGGSPEEVAYPSANMANYARSDVVSYPRLVMNGADAENMLGQAVASLTDVSDSLARATIDRIEQLDAKDPETAAGLRRIVVNWKGTAISALLLRDLKNDRAEPAAVLRLLAERKFLREKISQDIFELNSGTPTAKGLAPCFLEDQAAYDAVLKDQSLDTRIALLACGRLMRARLPIAGVAELAKSPNPELRSAAELFLESEDSAEARSIVLGLHPADAKILGATTSFKGLGTQAEPSPLLIALFMSVSGSPGTLPFEYGPTLQTASIEKTETRLQKEVKDDANLLGIYAYDSTYVRIYKDRVMLSWEDDPSRYHERQLTAEEFASLKDLLAANRVAEMKPFLACTQGNCNEPKELLMLSRNGGSRVYLRSSRKPQFFAGLEKILSDLRAEPAIVKYSLGNAVPGLQLLFANEELDAQTVWKHGSDLRVAVSNKAVREKVDAELDDMDEEDPDDVNGPDLTRSEPPADKVRRQRQYEGFAWRKLESGRLTEEVAQPAGVEFIPQHDDLVIPPGAEQWKARAAGSEIRVSESGLFKVAAGKFTKIKDGEFRNPVVSTDGRWLVVSHFDENEGPSLLRFDLTTNREYKVGPDAFSDRVARAYIPALGKFLLTAADDYDGPEEGDSESDDAAPDSAPSGYLLDPVTGRITQATGEIRPLVQQTFRPLQSTGTANEFWVAIPERGRNQTEFGKYDSRLMRFRSIAKLPKIAFDSMDMWVDDTEAKVYFVYNGHVLSLPIKMTGTANRATAQ